MPRKKQLIDKQIFKRFNRKCYFCALDDYDLLDVHRIQEGADGGEYTEHNSLTVCANCHRRIHAGQIKPIRKYLATNGHWLLLYLDEYGKENWL